MKNDEDKLYGEIFGADEEESQPAAKPAAPGKAKIAAAQPAAKSSAEEVVTGPGPANEADTNEAARLFQEMMADTRKATAAKKAQLPPPPPPPEPLMVRQAVPMAEEAPKIRFADSVAPWTLFKGVGTVAMLVYIIGFHGRLLHDSWPVLAVITGAITGVLLIVDYLRAAAQNAAVEPKKKRGA